MGYDLDNVDLLSMRLFEAEAGGETRCGSHIDAGSTELTLVREIAFPIITAEERVAIAILCVKSRSKDQNWNRWAGRWLSGEDRTAESANREQSDNSRWSANVDTRELSCMAKAKGWATFVASAFAVYGEYADTSHAANAVKEAVWAERVARSDAVVDANRAARRAEDAVALADGWLEVESVVRSVEAVEAARAARAAWTRAVVAMKDEARAAGFLADGVGDLNPATIIRSVLGRPMGFGLGSAFPS